MIEELILPGMLTEIGERAFDWCYNLKKIYLEGDCEFDLARIGLLGFNISAQIIPLSVTLPGGVRLQDLYMMKSVVIPDGVEKIGNHWFFGSEVESVKLPASVREIGEYAFRNCKNLKQITFSESS